MFQTIKADQKFRIRLGNNKKIHSYRPKVEFKVGLNWAKSDSLKIQRTLLVGRHPLDGNLPSTKIYGIYKY